jgi:hypothetical protein
MHRTTKKLQISHWTHALGAEDASCAEAQSSEGGIGAQSIGSGVVPWAQWSPSASLDRWSPGLTGRLDAVGFVAANVCKLTQPAGTGTGTGTCPETSQRTVSPSAV